MREIREESSRKGIILEVHKILLHRGLEYVYYDPGKRYYWPRINEEMKIKLTKCELCQIANRKKSGTVSSSKQVDPLKKSLWI